MSLKRLLKNIKFLLKNDLRNIIKDNNYLENLVEEKIIAFNDENKIIDFFSISDTLNHLTNDKISFCRFGDGEIQLIKGNDIPFQKSSPLLSQRLIEVLSSKRNEICIAIPSYIYKSKERLGDVSKNFWMNNGKNFRDTIHPFLSTDKKYYPAEVTIIANSYNEVEKLEYFNNFKNIWKNKDISIICGKSVFEKINYNIFECAKSIEYIYAPSINAFEEYDNILSNALQIDKKRIIISILGPTAKILSYDLSCNGYKALDLGHIAKSYDWYKKGKNTLNLNDAIDFYNPD